MAVLYVTGFNHSGQIFMKCIRIVLLLLGLAAVCAGSGQDIRLKRGRITDPKVPKVVRASGSLLPKWVGPADTLATRETVNLYRNLDGLRRRGVLFGHQDSYAYGVNWKFEAGRSDVRDVSGDYPGVLGCEIGRLEVDAVQDLDGVPFDSIRSYIRQAYARGSVVTVSWHLNNPLTGKSAWDASEGAVGAAVPGGAANATYRAWLDKVADFMGGLRGVHGELIPVIFRPFHELNGSWFWWGKSHCTAEEMKALYRYTVDYLRGTKGVHNLLYAYNTDRFGTVGEFLERYPGDAWVDVVGFDIYQKGDIAANAAFVRVLDTSLTMLEGIAHGHHKVAALTEFGYNTVPDSTWWTGVLWKGLGRHQVAYALGWRNAGLKPNGEVEYWVPYTGQVSAKDFVRFARLGGTLFAQDARRARLYADPVKGIKKTDQR